jgi:hypothetical protein
LDGDLVIFTNEGNSYTDYFIYTFLPFEHITQNQEAAGSVGWGVNVTAILVLRRVT